MNDTSGTPTRPAHPKFREATRYWLKLGLISFGGPAGQIAIMHQELVERSRWISERRFLHALNYCMLLPGPEAQQLAIYIGWLLHRTTGGIVAGTLFVLPSLFILATLTWNFLEFEDAGIVQGVFDGIKPAVVAIVFFAVWRIGSRTLRNRLLWTIAALSFLAIFAFKVRFPLIVLGAGLLGSIGGWIRPELFRAGAVHGAGGTAPSGPAVIDDDSVTPAHARFDPVGLALLAIAFVALWAAAVLMLDQPLLRSMALFFTKAALLTFGGAYAVLPYVYQGAVKTHQWLTGPQMIDGLALGETTPGPLIMVVAFVGFVGGWGGGIFGADMPVLGGIAGASVATLFTFLPGYLFILAGAPLVESTQGNLRFTAPLTAITAAVVGVVLNLALFFAWHLLWPGGTDAEPLSGPFQWFHALLSVAAFVALRVFGQGIVRVIAACAVIGLVQTFTVGA